MHPELLKIGPFTVYSYGLMLGIAFVAGTFLAAKEVERKGMGKGSIFDFFLITLIVSVVVSRLFYVAFRLHAYLSAPLGILDIRDGGLAIHGGLLGGIGVGLWYSRRNNISFWRLADALAPSLALGIGITRWGCLLAGCCYGTLSTLPWAVSTHYAPGWRHPAQIYESILDLAIFGLLWARRKKRATDGQLFLAFVGLYSIARFFVEFYREADLKLGPVTVAQAGSIVLAILTSLVSLYLGKVSRSRSRTQGSRSEPL